MSPLGCRMLGVKRKSSRNTATSQVVKGCLTPDVAGRAPWVSGVRCWTSLRGGNRGERRFVS